MKWDFDKSIAERDKDYYEGFRYGERCGKGISFVMFVIGMIAGALLVALAK